MAGRTGRTGGAGYDADLTAMLAVDVDLTGLERGLNEARGRTASALGAMETNVQAFGRSSRFAFQNAAFQVQDFAVQVAGGQGAVRALSQNLPQLLGGFGIWGAAAGAVVAVMGGLIQTMNLTGATAGDLDEQLDELTEGLNDLKDRFDDAVGAAQDFAGARLESAALAGIRELQESIEDVTGTYQELLNALKQGDVGAGAGLFDRVVSQLERLQETDLGPLGNSVRAIGEGILNWFSGVTLLTAALDALEGGLDPELEASIQQLAEQLDAGTISAIEFGREMEALAAAQPGPVGDQIRGIKDALIENRAAAEQAQQKIAEMKEELAQGFELGGLDKIRDKIKEITNELVIARAPERERPGLEVRAAAGQDLLRAPEPIGPTAEDIERINQGQAALNRLEKSERAAEAAARDAAAQAKRQADALEDLGAKTAAITLQREALQRGGPFGGEREVQQVEDLAAAAEKFGFTIDTLKDAPPIIRETVQQFVEEKAALREVEAAHENIIKVLQLRARESQRAVEAQREAEERALRDQQRETSREIEREEGRIEAGGRLPDEIDAANLAARELSTTLTDIDNLTFDSLLGALTNIGLSLAQQVIQALIFQAIMTAIGAASGTAVPGGTVTAIPARAYHGALFRGGRMTTAQHGAVFRRGEQALMTGAISGAALLEGARDEAAMPLTRTSRGDLGVMVEGKSGPTNVFNIDARNAQPGTASTMINMIHRYAPGAVVNAKSRGQIRDRPSF